MNYLRIWLMLLALFFGWFHMARPARGQSLIMVGEGVYEIDTTVVYERIKYTTAEDVCRMIDSAFKEYIVFPMPCEVKLIPVRPDSCMTVDTIIMPVYIRKTAVTHDRARNERRLWDSTWNIIDTTYRYTKTEGPCDD